MVEKDFANFVADYDSYSLLNFKNDIYGMKKFVIALVALFLVSVPALKAEPDIRDLLGGLAGAGSSGSGQSTLSDALGGLVSGLLGSGQLSEEDLAGVYAYKEPAITFKSDNLLQKAGGAAMASTIVDKLSPYYDRAGMKNLVVTLTPEKTFEFALSKIKLSGTFSRDSTQTSANSFIFTFKALGQVSIGTIDADVQRSGNGLIMTFDASKLLTLMNTVAQLTGKQTLQAAASLLNSYDGLNCGFSLTKTAEVASSSGTTAPVQDSNASPTSTDATTGVGSLLNLLPF